MSNNVKRNALEEGLILATFVNDATAPWLFAAETFFVLFAVLKTFDAWRATKRSQYFFLRRQAEKQLQNHFLSLFALIVLTGATYFWISKPVVDTTPRYAVLTNTKPRPVAASPLPTPDSEGVSILPVDSPQAIEINSLMALPEVVGVPAGSLTSVDLTVAEVAPVSLPTQYDQFEPTAELTDKTQFTPLLFSTEITEEYQPINPQRIFSQGYFRVYATFTYDGMADGMVWAWVWLYNGEVIEGGNEFWNYSDDGPGWIYYEPPTGFDAGEYTLQVWVNRQLFGQATMLVEADVANQ